MLLRYLLDDGSSTSFCLKLSVEISSPLLLLENQLVTGYIQLKNVLSYLHLGTRIINWPSPSLLQPLVRNGVVIDRIHISLLDITH